MNITLLLARMIPRTKVTVDTTSDETGSGVLDMRFSQWKPNNVKTWYVAIPTPERNETPTVTANMGSMLMESKTRELPDTIAAPNSTIMQNMRRPSIVSFFADGR